MNNQLQLCSFEQAKKLKIMGFDWPVDVIRYESDSAGAYPRKNVPKTNWNDNCETISIPTIQLALKWFRDVKLIVNAVCVTECDYPIKYYGQYESPSACHDEWDLNEQLHTEYFDTFEQAESALLDELLKLEL